MEACVKQQRRKQEQDGMNTHTVTQGPPYTPRATATPTSNAKSHRTRWRRVSKQQRRAGTRTHLCRRHSHLVPRDDQLHDRLHRCRAHKALPWEVHLYRHNTSYDNRKWDGEENEGVSSRWGAIGRQKARTRNVALRVPHGTRASGRPAFVLATPYTSTDTTVTHSCAQAVPPTTPPSDPYQNCMK